MLYLAWLAAVQRAYGVPTAADLSEWSDDDAEDYYAEPDEIDLEQLEPPVPPGLRKLSAPFKALVNFFRLDEDLFAVAAEASADTGRTELPVEELVAALPDAERQAFLVRLTRGETGLSQQLVRRLRELAGDTACTSVDEEGHRTVGELLTAAAERRQRRAERRHRAAEKKRIRYLEELERREPEAWQQVVALIEKKLPSAYDEAMPLLIDLRDLANSRARREAFDLRVREIAAKYHNRPALLGRLRERGLLR